MRSTDLSTYALPVSAAYGSGPLQRSSAASGRPRTRILGPSAISPSLQSYTGSLTHGIGAMEPRWSNVALFFHHLSLSSPLPLRYQP